MGRIVFVNGSFLPEEEARVSVFDRGFLMADAVYEVTSVLGGRLVDFDGHMQRLHRSLAALGMPDAMDDAALLALHRDLVARNGVEDGMVYLQISRGNPGDRDFAYPDPAAVAPTVVAFTQSKPGLADNPAARTGWRVVTVPDLRWARRDIKTVQLLYPSMAKMAAKAAGADDAWFVAEDGRVTEGSSNNVWIVTGGKLVTRALSHDILGGITRSAVMRLAQDLQLGIEERSFTVAEAQAAEEAFATSASAFVMPVVSLDGVGIGDGTPGPVSQRLRAFYLEEMRRAAV